MRLLIFSTEFPPGPGGIGTHAWQLARNMHRLGWQVRVLTLQDYAAKGEIETFNHQQPFPVQTLEHQRLPVLEGAHRWHCLRRLENDWQPDVLVATGEQAVLIAAAMKRNIPRVAIWHGVIPPKGWQQNLYRRAYQRADQIVAVSHYSYSQLVAMGIQPRRGLVITNGADADQFMPISDKRTKEFRQEIGVPFQPLLLTVGNISERKGQDIVIRAMPTILKEYPEVHYIIVGLPTSQEELTKLARALGVANRVHFLGKVAQESLPTIYNACDVFVLTSRHSSDGEFEGYGIVAVEAALCGKPSVVSNNSGLMEAIRDGETGIVVPENDPQATAHALISLLADPGRVVRMGQAARMRALQEQTWGICMRQYEVVLEQLIKPVKRTSL